LTTIVRSEIVRYATVSSWTVGERSKRSGRSAA
jgi:hypothetical protein